MPRQERSKIPTSHSLDTFYDRSRASSVTSTISLGVNGKQTDLLINEVKPDIKREILNDIESLQPDHEQRKLAIEVNFRVKIMVVNNEDAF